VNGAVQRCLERLERRSAAEKQRLEELRSAGGTALRDEAPSLMLDVGPEVGRLLNMLARAGGARNLVEVGGSVGYSTIWLAEAAAATGGRVLSIEPDPGKHQQQRANLEEAGLLGHVELANETSDKVLPLLGPGIDLVLLDHWKELYARDFDTLWPKIRRGGLVVADNILVPVKNAAAIAGYLARVRETEGTITTTLNIGDGIEITCKE
jgi:predicted O-methyltransferase YrrM